MKRLFIITFIIVIFIMFISCPSIPTDKITVIKPEAGSVFTQETSMEIQWTYNGELTSFDIKLVNPDTTEVDIQTGITATASPMTHNWTIPASVSEGSGYKIKVISGTVSGLSGSFSVGETKWTKVADTSELYTVFYNSVHNSSVYAFEPRGIGSAKTTHIGNGKFFAMNFITDTPTPQQTSGSTTIFSKSLEYFNGTNWVNGFWTHNADSGCQAYAGLSYAGSNQAIMFGGAVFGTTTPTQNLFRLIDNTIPATQITNATGTAVSERHDPLMAYVGGNKVLITLGYTPGETEGTVYIQLTSGIYNNSTNAWSAAANFASPLEPRLAASISYAGGTQAVIYGGDGNADLLSDTIIYDSSTDTFTQLNLTVNPGPLAYYSMCYIGSDTNGGVVLLFGGATNLTEGSQAFTNKTWILRKNSTGDWYWEEQIPNPELTARASSILISSGNGKARLIGGRFDFLLASQYASQIPFAKDEWEFDLGETLTNEMN